MKRLLSFLLLLALPVSAANYYVRPTAQGSNNGTDWNNAWSIASMSAAQGSLTFGDTVWLAGGSYNTTLVLTCSGVTFKRVTAADSVPASAAGWNAAFDSTVNYAAPNTGGYNNSQIKIQGNFTTWTGNVTNGMHFSVVNGGYTHNAFMLTGTSNTVSYCEVQGPGPGVNHGGTLRMMALYGTRNTSSHNWAHGLNQPYTAGASQNALIEYDTVESNGRHLDVATYHDDMMEYSDGASGMTIRYCTWNTWSAEGIMMWGGAAGSSGSIYIYGNVFINGGAGGVVWPSYTAQTEAGPVYFYNNTLIRAYASGDQDGRDESNNLIKITMGKWTTGSQARNNICVTNDSYAFSLWHGWPMADDDYQFGAHMYLAGPGWYFTDHAPIVNGPFSYGANSITNGVADPFVNSAAGDYRIVSTIGATYPRNKGADLGAPYNLDRYGNVRGADGTWDIGAFEYDEGITNPPVITSALTASGTNGVWFSYSITASNAVTTYGVGATTLPAGLSLNSSSGVISGTPNVSSPPVTTNITIAVTNAAGYDTDTLVLSIYGADATPPTITLTAPTNGATVSGYSTLTATASDNIGVVSVSFYVDDALVAADNTSPYSYSLSTYAYANGSHTFTAFAQDAQTNITWSATNTVTVTNYVSTNAVYWALNEGSGTAGLDGNGTSNSLTLDTGYSWSAGKFSTGLTMMSTNRVTALNTDALDLTNHITVACWVKATNVTDWFQIVTKPYSETLFIYPFFAYHVFGGEGADASHWKPCWQLVNDQTNSVFVPSTNEVVYGDWVHVAGTYDGANLKVYVNGVLSGGAAQTNAIVSFPTRLFVGQSGANTEPMAGVLDEVRIYPAALTAGEVTALYNWSPTPTSGTITTLRAGNVYLQ